jgi:hypothetical protein
MSGDVVLPDGRAWLASSWNFYWVVETLAEKVPDQELAAHLREISEEHLGILDLGALTEAQQQEIRTTAARLPEIARTTWNQPEENEPRIRLIEELVALLTPA